MGKRRSPLAALVFLCAAGCAVVDETDRIVHRHDVRALAGVTRLVGDLVVERAAVRDLSGLDLQTVTGDVVVRANASLASLAGLDRLASIGGRLIVEQNPRLTSLFELAALREVGGAVVVADNEALSRCEGAALLAQVRRGVDADPAACEGAALVDAR